MSEFALVWVEWDVWGCFGMQEHDLAQWDRLAGSPYPSVGRSSSNVSSLDLDLESVSSDDMEDDDEGSQRKLDSAVHIDELDHDFAYSFFVRQGSYSFLRGPNGRMYENRRPVYPVCVSATSIRWSPFLLANGQFAHEFELLDAEDKTTSTITLHPDLSLILQHNHYSRLMRAAGMAPASLRVEFADIRARRQELLTLFGGISSGSMYLPTGEVVTGNQMTPSSSSFLTPVVPSQFDTHELAQHASTAWLAVCHELVALSHLVTNACKQHNANELGTAQSQLQAASVA